MTIFDLALNTLNFGVADTSRVLTVEQSKTAAKQILFALHNSASEVAVAKEGVNIGDVISEVGKEECSTTNVWCCC